MKPIRKEDLDTLLTDGHPPAISIYMPTVRAGREVQQNAIRFGNLLRAAGQQLDDYTGDGTDGLDEGGREALLAPLTALRDDNEFWQHQSSGLVVFRDRERLSVHALPVEVKGASHVGSTFVVRPLLPLVDFDGRFHVLAFGQETVELYTATRYSIRPVILPEDTPTCLQDVVGATLDGPHLQHHSGNGTGRTAVFHGQGAGSTKEDGELRKYAAWVARTLPTAMDPKAPVVLAGTERNVGLFRGACDWPTLCEGWIHGAPGGFGEETLQSEGWAIAEPVIRARRMRHLDQIGGLASAGKATHDPGEALEAARAGRVEALYLTPDVAGDPARLEALAREAWLKGARVFEVEASHLPGEATLAAVLRY